MLDWKGIGVNALWVIGLALCLAAVSHADWWAHSRRVTRRRAWGTPMFLRPFYAGLLLVAASLFLGADSMTERILWGAWSLLLAGQSIQVWRRPGQGNHD
jgi:hypothetical protein